MRRSSPTSRSDERGARFRTEFGAALDAQLAPRGLRQSDVASATGRSASYLNQTMTGAKPALPEWVDIIAEAIGLDEEQRQALHRAAARDRGYKIP